MYILRALQGSWCVTWTGEGWSRDIEDAKPFYTAAEVADLIDHPQQLPGASDLHHFFMEAA